VAPQVSVVLPVFEARSFLQPALDSIARQTLTDFEAVCVDDWSRDGSETLLDKMAAKDSRFRVLHPGRIGLVEAINLGCRTARAPLLARMDGDDVMAPRRLQLQVAQLRRHPEVQIVSGLVRHFPAGAILPGNRAYEEWLNGLVTHDQITRDIFVESPVPNPATTMRREVFERLGGYRDLDPPVPEDYDFWLRASEAGFRFEKIERVLHFWRDHPDRVTRTDPRCSLQAFLRAKADALLRGPLAPGRPFLIWGAGMTGRRLTRLLIKAGRPPRALLDIDPQKTGRTRHGRPVLPPQAVRMTDLLVLAAVGARGARTRIRSNLNARGLIETRDFWMVA